MLKKILSLTVLIFSLVGCSSEFSAVYQNVNAESKWDESARIVINSASNEPPLFKVADKQLYLS